MGVTRFPNGINVGAGTDLGGIACGTIVVPSGASGTAFSTGLTSVAYVTASPYSSVASVAGFAGVVASASGGSVTLIGVSGAGTASTANGTATWMAIGS
jgi:hypothetical protein